MKLKAACAQMRSNGDKAANLATVGRLMAAARRRGARFIAFPENFTFFTDDGEAFRRGIEAEGGATVTTLRGLARRHGLWLLAGGIPLIPPRGARARGPKGLLATNSSLLIGADGRLKARYDKIHLFDAKVAADRVYRESESIAPGRGPVLAKTPWGGLGLSVCYDLRFAELYRGYAARGARMLAIPAAFTKVTGLAHWDVLTRARAIENQCFVLCPAQWGHPYKGRETYGHARIIDPWGKVLAECGPRGDGLAVAELDFDVLTALRRRMPVLEHRRLD